MRSFCLALIAATATVVNANPYVFINKRTHWAQARHDCMQRGMNLARIDSKHENNQALQASRGQGGWIGGSDTKTEGKWQYYTFRGSKYGRYLTYSNWNRGEPNGKRGENYIHMLNGGYWNDIKPSQILLGIICKRRNPAKLRAEARAKAAAHKKAMRAKALAAHHRRVRAANAAHYRHHNNMFNRNIRSSKTWYSYIRSNTAHFRHTTAMRAHRNKMVAKYFAARNHAGRWASIRNHRWSVARKNRAMMNKTRKTANWWSRHTANMNKNRIAKSRHWSAMRNQQRKYARWGVNQVRHAQRQRSAWNRKWAGIVARAAKANRAALAAYHKANAQKSKAWKGYHASNANYLRHLKAYRSAVGTLRHAHSRKAYWLKLARVSHHKLVSYVRSGAGRGYFH